MYTKDKYKQKSAEVVKKEVKKMGFNPIIINDPPGRTYSPHTHPETKLLAILDGKMDVKTGGKQFALAQGDELIIPGRQKHSAVVGENGCRFFWSEEMLGEV